MLLVKKMAIFPSLFFRQYRLGKCLLQYSRTKNAFLGYKNKKIKQSKNWHFSKGNNQCFWYKNGHFSNFIFQVIQARKMSLTILQNEKTPLQAIKKSSKSQKFHIFLQALTHAFSPKIAIFPSLFYRQYRLGKFLLRCSRTKKPLSRL